jgi:folate-binding protein YgfZ
MTHVSPAAEFVRLRASGRDRARFLHNFCTNNIKDLAVGTACEAFFTDVKARVLAHGYVLALQNVHEVWILPGDPEALLKHLTRYIITEDVQIERIDPGEASIAVLCTPQVVSALSPEFPGASFQSLDCFSRTAMTQDSSTNEVTGLSLTWAGQSILAISSKPEFIEPFTARLSANGIDQITGEEFERLRIDERFPIVGRDLTSENLAPEAERNASAISYTKGCYLGQEPIARLDAMGHVNRALRIVEIESLAETDLIVGAPLQTADEAAIGTITSACRVSPGLQHGLAMVRLASANASLHVLSSSDHQLTARVLPT